ncbi:hypothetical protein LEP1GSC062_4200 [Leptospira alexanderi serovar Manhao 3 str. L 60]|uniref:Uncharacterized protein n=1 Tax=Leptospira alexanderi serovar Manhao 3 str. L 60 TaxID=1049759 RepID=V6HYH7_9LEPT|nr:hypothetical protein LEP1GSC062_4200 [Leptospira alexanderi serovar Manhao 3 str. L 60]
MWEFLHFQSDRYQREFAEKSMIHFSEKSWNPNFVNLFLKCGNYPNHDFTNKF